MLVQADPDQIHQPEHAGARGADRLAHQQVGLLHGQPAGERLADGGGDPVDAQPVGDEPGGVVAAHDRLAQPDVGERLHRLDRLGTRVPAPAPPRAAACSAAG